MSTSISDLPPASSPDSTYANNTPFVRGPLRRFSAILAEAFAAAFSSEGEGGEIGVISFQFPSALTSRGAADEVSFCWLTFSGDFSFSFFSFCFFPFFSFCLSPLSPLSPSPPPSFFFLGEATFSAFTSLACSSMICIMSTAGCLTMTGGTSRLFGTTTFSTFGIETTSFLFLSLSLSLSLFLSFFFPLLLLSLSLLLQLPLPLLFTPSINFFCFFTPSFFSGFSGIFFTATKLPLFGSNNFFGFGF